MDISVIIAQVLGIFFVVVGVSMVANSKASAVAIQESVQHKGVLYVWGLLALLIGAVIVVFNNLWTSGLPLLVTILGWLALVKGAFIVVFPGAAGPLYQRLNKSWMLVLCGVIVFVLGVILLYW